MTRPPGAAPGPLRHVLFVFVAVVVIPILSLGALEGALRLIGWGYPPGFFVARRVDGQSMWSENPRFGWRFFPKDIARGPERFLLEKRKPSGTLRVFVLGESAAMGDPSPAFGIPRMLQAMLEAARPGTRFEVVNAAMTAINSHVIRVIGRDCLEHEADALVVYAGNNEIVGPFGVGSVFGSPGADRALVRSIVAVRASRVGQLADAVVGRLRPPPPAWTGMEQFLGTRLAFEDPRLDALAATYRANLAEICERARARDVPVLLCTMAVNLKDGGPFGSEEPRPADGDVAAWRGLVAEGDAAWTAGDTTAARDAWDRAAERDARPADLAYRRARAMLGRDDEAARVGFGTARDRDMLRFRCDSRLAAQVDTLAADSADRGVRRVDVRAAVDAASSHGIPGREVFDDHVHYNFAGNYVASRAIAAALLAVLPGGAAGDSTGLPSAEAVARRLGYTPASRYATVTTMAARRASPPFTAQLDAAGQTAFLNAEADSLRPSTQPHALRRALADVEAVLAEHPDDRTLRAEHGDLLARTGNLRAALEEREWACRRFPWDADGHYAYGQTLRQLGREEESMREFRTTIELFPGHFLAQAALGEQLAARGDLAGAADRLRAAVLRYPEYALAWRSLGDVLLRQGKAAEALPALQRAVAITPGLAGAHKRMGDALAELGRRDEAEAAWLKAVVIHPRFAAAHARLAELYRARGDAARAAYHESLARESGTDSEESESSGTP